MSALPQIVNANTAGSGEDDLDAAVIHLRRQLLTGSHIAEGTLIDHVFGFQANLGGQILVGISHPLLEAPVKFLHRRNFHATDESEIGAF